MVKHENDTTNGGGLDDEYESRSTLSTRTIADTAAVRFILAIFAPRAYALSAPSPALRSVWASATVSRLTPLL